VPGPIEGILLKQPTLWGVDKNARLNEKAEGAGDNDQPHHERQYFNSVARVCQGGTFSRRGDGRPESQAMDAARGREVRAARSGNRRVEGEMNELLFAVGKNFCDAAFEVGWHCGPNYARTGLLVLAVVSALAFIVASVAKTLRGL
jgi:hypothetical protein